MNITKKLFILIFVTSIISCEDGIRDITGGNTNGSPTNVTEVKPIDITQDGFDFLEKMQGHWTGMNRVITDDYPWFAFDYRAISPSHIHGIHEGGTAGNLLTSFFVTDYKNTRTIIARNGGLLNGIYRSSYFVMDSISQIASNEKYFRFVDAIGGKGIMFFELKFKNDSLYFNAYTSNLGLRTLPTRHMTFKAKKRDLELSQSAANEVGFPQNIAAWDFSNGFITDNLYITSGETRPVSATFLAQANNNDVYTLATQSGDPFTILDHPRLGSLTINMDRNTQITGDVLLCYLSKKPLTDTNGFFTTDADAYETILHFPALSAGEDRFFYSYLHPGNYYVTIVADKDNSFGPSQGDFSSRSTLITIGNEEHKTISITNINIQN
ncbi:hypothetical protein RQM59_09520 [Flavobacteriaceae bacterium S356]|uniref:DUF4302 domain-containing protein n=1 Tax=Asprobacillus argus TaxID=3076534 RepID=A0ABU3LFW5_9FLAO|nr:hypothetical protein [Flavobacteriaceae bacterium S356]